MYFPLLLHCSAPQREMPQTDFQPSPSHPHTQCPQAKDKSSYWAHHLDVLTLCGMIYRKAASITVSLAPCIDKMLKIQNCQDGTVHSLWLKQPSAHSPGHTHTHKKKATVPKTMAQSISAKKQKTRSCLLNSERWSHHQHSLLSNQYGELCLLSSGWELRGSHGHGPSNFPQGSKQTGMERFNNKSACAFLFPALVYSE